MAGREGAFVGGRPQGLAQHLVWALSHEGSLRPNQKRLGIRPLDAAAQGFGENAKLAFQQTDQDSSFTLLQALL